ncbi:hypothetical protein GC722_09200 [Auraticoccus sp. F435]|uniref:Hemerythrin-like domain-containing protein n=1 Tax=Auraticoccus cholistanensis TaxID=2656650 RepID=A0A6A9UU48_9ACTN|nr:hemerythrin domain-containing protein [Auraticoccus cholistanensis]MVA76198.1 hypothetical protein [Auraticoccus cholistanensis]
MSDPSGTAGQPTAPAPEPLGVLPTAPPATRLARTGLLDEAARPTAGPPAAGVRYTAQQTATAQHLVDVHDHLRAELEQVRAMADQVLEGALTPGLARSAINQLTMRQNSWTLGAYCQSYCRLVTAHHTYEDRGMLPHLRRAQPSLAPVVDQLQAEHEVIHEVLERLDRALVALVDGPGGGEQVREAVDLLTDTLLSHLSYEEHQLVEPLARHGFGY